MGWLVETKMRINLYNTRWKCRMGSSIIAFMTTVRSCLLLLAMLCDDLLY